MGLYSRLKENIRAKAINKAVEKGVYYLSKNPSKENLIKIIDTFFKRLPTSNETYRIVVSNIKKLIEEDHPAITFIRRVLVETDSRCLYMFVRNLIVNGFVRSSSKRQKVEALGSHSPFSILISPTMRCNLACRGCYAAGYSKSDELDLKIFDRIVAEGERMGVFLYTILGGEPLLAKEKIFRVCKRHPDSYFQFFTNGTLITEDVVRELKRLGNIMPIISIEGRKEETDKRRGKGTYEKIMNVMDLIKKYKVPFGYSVTITRKNVKIISSEEFLDKIIKKGAFMGWYFLYMPLGEKPSLELMPTPKQRFELMKRWKQVRDTKPIFIIDFWNDAPSVGGCIAGKSYIHINSKGDVEPCIFTHFAIDNIKNKSLLQIMKSDFFKELRKRQPFNDNLYMPCMWIDNPEVGREICEKTGCYPTHPGADIIIKNPKIKRGLSKYSKEVKRLYDPVWKKESQKPIEVKKTRSGVVC